jgi:hypothetical protein
MKQLKQMKIIAAAVAMCAVSASLCAQESLIGHNA